MEKPRIYYRENPNKGCPIVHLEAIHDDGSTTYLGAINGTVTPPSPDSFEESNAIISINDDGKYMGVFWGAYPMPEDK